MKRAVVAASVYFAALFALGFLIGTFRVLVVAPSFGPLIATAAEVPVMLTAAYVACRWVVRRWQVPRTAAVRLIMAAWFIALLLSFEMLFGALLFDRSVTEQAAILATPAGLIGLAAQITAALLPLWVGRGAPR